MNVDDLVGALRATDGEDPDLADMTRLRVQRSLESGARTQHRLAGLLAAAGILFGGTVSWALATGKIGAMWSPSPAPVIQPVDDTPAPKPRPARPTEPAKPVITATPAPTVLPMPEVPAIAAMPEPPPPETRPAPKPRPARARAIEPAPGEALYRRAHDLHFHGGDPGLAVAAWDAYLAAEPAGRFAVDARYNRALMLIRLRRYAEARAALAPFAQGEVEPTGYHQAEAEQLIERLARVR
jgi:hypothetical protein